MNLYKSLLAAAAFALSAGAMATPVSNTNVRPVTIGTTPSNESTLQSVLNGLFGVNAIDANTGQSTVGKWGSSSSSATTIPTLIIEQTSGASVQEFGIWFGSDSSNLLMIDLFLGGAVGGTNAFQQTSTAIAIMDHAIDITRGAGFASACGVATNCTTVYDSRINPNDFGFYFQTGNQTAFSIDNLNRFGDTRFLAFQDRNTTNWAFAYEDGTDGDFQDMVVKVESISAVPEPASLALLGLGLAGVAVASRRKNPKA